MFIKQSKNTFIRTTKRYGYITNQLTQHDRTYNEDGALWLKQITRDPKDIDTIIKQLMGEYEDAEYDVIKKDFLEFVDSLVRDRFVVIGETIEELENTDEDFTYSIDNPKTLVVCKV